MRMLLSYSAARGLVALNRWIRPESPSSVRLRHGVEDAWVTGVLLVFTVLTFFSLSHLA